LNISGDHLRKDPSHVNPLKGPIIPIGFWSPKIYKNNIKKKNHADVEDVQGGVRLPMAESTMKFYKYSYWVSIKGKAKRRTHDKRNIMASSQLKYAIRTNAL